MDTKGFGLSSLVLFQDCSDDELRRIAPLTGRRRVSAGTTIVRAGEPVHDLLLVLHGAVQVVGEMVDGTLAAGDLVGEISVLSGEPATATVTATEDAELLTIDAAHVPTLLAMPTVGPRLRAIAKARVHAAPGQVVTAASVPIIRKPPRVRGPGAGLHAGRRAHPARTVVLSLLALVVVGATTFILTQRNKSTVVGIDDLLAQVELPPASPGSPTTAPATPTQAPPVRPTPGAEVTPSPPPDTVSTPTAAPAEAPTDAAEAPSPAPDTPTGFSPPTQGIYTYATEGSEQISIAGARHEYPDETFAVVQQSSPCDWKIEHHVLREHVDHRSFCSDGEAVSVLSFATEVTFFGQKDGLTYVCSPPAVVLDESATPGASATGLCRSPDQDSEAHYTGVFVGLEAIAIGDQSLEAAHLSIDFEMTGAARGTSHLEQWIDPATGMILRLERTVDTLADSVWGDVRYQEEATFHLDSMEPRR